MHIPYKPLVVSCLLGMLSIPIMGCGGSAGATTPPLQATGGSFDHLEHAGADPIWRLIEQRSIGRSGQRAGNVYLLTCRRDGAPGRIAEAHSHLHTYRHHHLFHSYCQRAAYGCPGHSGDHLGTVISHYARDRPRCSAVGCHCECARYLLLQSGGGHGSAHGHTTADSLVCTVRRDRLRVSNGARLTHRYGGARERPHRYLEHAGADPIRHRIEQCSIGRDGQRPG